MTTEQEQELKQLAYEEVAKPVYPEPVATLEDEITAMIEKRDLFHAGTLEDMPSNPLLKSEMHDDINDDVEDLVVENARIIAENRATRVSVDLAYENAITAFIANPVNIQRVKNIIAQRQRDSELGTMQWQLSQLLQAYQAAQMLGDDVAMVESRAEYQNLLTEYNAKIGGA